MKITINGEKTEIAEEEVNLTRLLAIRHVESPDMVSVQVNGEIVDRADFDSTRMRDSDEVEFLYFMGGG